MSSAGWSEGPGGRLVTATDLVIFDMDGVLVDSEPISARITTAALNEIGYAASEAEIAARFTGTSTKSMLEAVAAELGRPLPDGFRDELRARVLDAMTRELQPVAGMEGLLTGLTVPRCVASSSHPERIAHALRLTGLDDGFGEHLFSAEMVEHGKPAPDLFLFAARRMGFAPERCLVVEDSEPGVEAGVAAGMRVLGFTAASHVRHDEHAPRLLAKGAQAVAADAATLGRWIDELVNGAGR